MRKLPVLILGISLCGCGGAEPAKPIADPLVVEAQTHFTFKGRSIPPFFLTDFCGGPEADDFWTKGVGMRIGTVAVEGLFYDNCDGAYSGCKIAKGELIRFELPNEGNGGPRGNGWFGYRFLGTTPSGISVVEYVGNTGGSGTVPGVMFLRFEMETIGYQSGGKKERLVMRFLGEQSWGDRVYREVKLVGNELRLGPERTNMPMAGPLDSARTIMLD